MKSPLAILTALTLVFLGVTCACDVQAISSTDEAKVADHAHHADHVGHSDHADHALSSGPCTHSDCGSNCLQANLPGATIETTSKFSKILDLDVAPACHDDLLFPGAAGSDATGPPVFLLVASTTPVTRHDLLLE